MPQPTLKILTEKTGVNQTYRYVHSVNSTAREVMYMSHSHYGIEIFSLIKGKIDFHVEQNTYLISPNDVVLINENELHHFLSLKETQYERIVLHVSPTFFEKYGLTEYHKAFTDRAAGVHNLIPAYIAESTGIISMLRRIEQYITENPVSDMVIDAALIELLYMLSRIRPDSLPAKSNETITKILQYINEHLTEPLPLEEIAKAFFISKCHLCRIFKANTGFTINDYIANKRIILVKSLCREGMDIGEAATRAGFDNYSNFYRVYVSKTGTSPRETLKQKNNGF